VHAESSALHRDAARSRLILLRLARSLKTQQRTYGTVEVNVYLGELSGLTIVKTHRRAQRLPE
jgi:hypothetical protein